MDLQKIEILLIEDNPEDAIFTILAFKEYGLDKNVIHLKNGEEALDFIFKEKMFYGKLFSNKTKIILLDIRMPKIDGIEVLEKLKESSKTKHIPVIILTSSADDPIVESCKILGAADYILKPVTMEGFEKVISGLSEYWLS